MQVDCDNCQNQVEEEDVSMCEVCERDGLCPDCVLMHECEGGER